MQRKWMKWASTVAIAGGFLGCGGEEGNPGMTGPDGRDGDQALVRVTEEAPGDNCAAGGSKIEAGQDVDGDEMLADDEVMTVEYACEGADGADGDPGSDGMDASDGALAGVRTSDEPAGDNCPDGGTKIEVGKDTDADGLPDDDVEVVTSYLCDGADGENGAGRVSTTTQLSDEPPGDNCASGGQKVEYGLDADESGALSNEEIMGVTYVCNGADGTHGVQALVVTSEEEPGAQCMAGGTQLDYGLDVDASGTLEASEVLATRYVCDGTDGTDAMLGLVSVTSEPTGAQCAAGGQKIESGVDTDGDESLASGEVIMTQYICDGTDGVDGSDGADALRMLVETTSEAAGSNCVNGGQKIVTGVDADGNGSLASSEIRQTEYVCNGLDGSDGADGSDALLALVNVVAEPAGSNCVAGGRKVESGLDDDADGALEAAEVDDTDFVCDGEDGTDGADGSDGATGLVAVTSEPAGSNCTAGGEKIEAGLDADGDDVLDGDEVESTRYVCNGEDGADGTNGTDGSDAHVSLVEVTDEAAGSNCVAGGQKVDYGFDADGDAVLDSAEIDGTRYVCNGADGADGANGSDGSDGLLALVATSDEPDGSNCTSGGTRIDVGLDTDASGTLESGEIDSTSYVCNAT